MTQIVMPDSDSVFNPLNDAPAGGILLDNFGLNTHGHGKGCLENLGLSSLDMNDQSMDQILNEMKIEQQN